MCSLAIAVMAASPAPPALSSPRLARPLDAVSVPLLPVSCGSVTAKFDLKLFKSESARGKKSGIKCVFAGSEWITPSKFEY